MLKCLLCTDEETEGLRVKGAYSPTCTQLVPSSQAWHPRLLMPGPWPFCLIKLPCRGQSNADSKTREKTLDRKEVNKARRKRHFWFLYTFQIFTCVEAGWALVSSRSDFCGQEGRQGRTGHRENSTSYYSLEMLTKLQMEAVSLVWICNSKVARQEVSHSIRVKNQSKCKVPVSTITRAPAHGWVKVSRGCSISKHF